MKVIGLDVPPEHVVAFEKLVAKPKVNSHGNGTARTRRSATRSRRLPPREKLQKDILAAVKFLAERIGKEPGSQDSNDFIGDQMAKLAQGIFEVAYWRKAEVLESVFITNNPGWSIDGDPSPYAYRREDNMPTIAHYGDGTIGGSSASYGGGTVDGFFIDGHLTWNRTVYKIDRRTTKKKAEPALIYWETNVNVNADARGSKPMFSTVLRCYMTTDDGEPITTLKNPVEKIPVHAEPNERGCTSLYWRYRIPAGDYPYWHGSIKRTMLKNLPTISTIDEGGTINRAVVCSAPRPMFGHAFNNNTGISTSVDSVPDIYQMPKAGPVVLIHANAFVPGFSNQLDTYDGYTYTDTWTTDDINWKTDTKMSVKNIGSPWWFKWDIAGSIQLPLAVIKTIQLTGTMQQYNTTAHPFMQQAAKGFVLNGDISYDEDEEEYTYTYDHFDYNYVIAAATPPAWAILQGKIFPVTRKKYKLKIGKGPEVVEETQTTSSPIYPVNYFVFIPRQ